MDRNSNRKLLVVESPTKAKTLKRYLDRDFVVLASKGHIKDLPENRLGVDIERGFLPKYILLKEKKPQVKEIVNAAKKSSIVYLGSDPDREGEAIAFHIAEEIKKAANPDIKRVLFFEITREEVRRAISEPGEIDINKVYAQQARRVLDRLVGYKVSPLLWKVISKGLSAGRVQTVALRLLCERERAILAFKPEKYYVIHAIFEKDGIRFKAVLKRYKDKRIERIKDKDEALKIVEALKNSEFEVVSYKETVKRVSPPPPLKTSTLQQEASNRFNFSSKRTMLLAQELYEGVDLPDGRRGLITYMRTDSVRIADKAIHSIRKLIGEKFESRYLPPKPRIYRDKGPVQGAHEAIRPTDVQRTPEDLKPFLRDDLLKIYTVIWKRAVASQVKEAEFNQRDVVLRAQDYDFESSGKTLIFDGFYKILGEPPKDNPIPKLERGEILKPVDINIEEKTTEPPRRYTEATLIRELESKGVGRPSTYAPTISTLFERKYVVREKAFLKPTELGMLVYDILIPRFPGLFDVSFTAKMEEELDKVEEGKLSWQELLEKFYENFKRELEEVENKIAEIKRETEEETGEKCPICGSSLIVKWGRYGKFLACSNFPDCKYSRPLKNEIVEGEKCPNCGKEMVIRAGKTGRFLVCIDYPKCKGVKPLSTGVKCPECGGDLIERRNRKGQVFYACSNYPDCKFTLSEKPLSTPCPECNYPLLVEVKRGRFRHLRCPSCRKTFKEKDIKGKS
jgi:DNA topoisomerase-1